jgi:hypothetical protein
MVSRVLTLALLGGALVAPALADELDRTSAPRGFVVRDAATVLGSHCSRDDQGIMWFTLPNGQRFELITSVLDPAIANPGDGAFHPFDASEVQAAIRDLRFPLSGIEVEIYILPYPRRGQMRSAAGPGLILLSPGVQNLSREYQHAEVVHELGHVVQYALMPDSDVERWNSYRGLRGIADLATYDASARHENRPHEIFAEDFRVLFGGALAVGSGSIENAALPSPQSVSGLREFLAGLAAPAAAARLVVSSNPARGPIQFRQTNGPIVPLDVFDVRGRRLMTLEPRVAGAEVEWRADSHGMTGPQVLFARPRSPGAPGARFIWAP